MTSSFRAAKSRARRERVHGRPVMVDMDLSEWEGTVEWYEWECAYCGCKLVREVGAVDEVVLR